MNVGEKICSYKARLGFTYFQEFADAAGVSGSWLNDISKKEKIQKVNDIGQLSKLCSYLGTTIDQLLKNDEIEKVEFKELEIIDINSIEDICILINNVIVLLQKDGVRMDDVLMNDKSKEVCIDALNVAKILVKQHL